MLLLVKMSSLLVPQGLCSDMNSLMKIPSPYPGASHFLYSFTRPFHVSDIFVATCLFSIKCKLKGQDFFFLNWIVHLHSKTLKSASI